MLFYPAIQSGLTIFRFCGCCFGSFFCHILGVIQQCLFEIIHIQCVFMKQVSTSASFNVSAEARFPIPSTHLVLREGFQVLIWYCFGVCRLTHICVQQVKGMFTFLDFGSDFTINSARTCWYILSFMQILGALIGIDPSIHSICRGTRQYNLNCSPSISVHQQMKLSQAAFLMLFLTL